MADNYDEVIEDLKTLKPDLILLDVKLIGEKDGVDVAKEINKNYKIPFIFLTSLSDYDTIERIKVTNPTGFINKPFNETGLRNNIEIALYNYKNKEKQPESNSYFFIKQKGKLIRINRSDILYIEAYDNYTFIHDKTKKYIVSYTLKSVLEKLNDARFIRIHRSFAVNINEIDSLFEGYVFIDSKRIPIGRMYKESLMQSISFL